jgi:hypothetical protein
MHLWENGHDSSVYLLIRRFTVRLRSKTAKLRARCIRKLKDYKQRYLHFRGLPSWKQDDETGYELAEVPFNGNIRRERIVKMPKGHFYTNATPKRLQKKLEADWNEPSIGWGLFFEESIVVPKIIREYLTVFSVLLLGALGISLVIELVRGSGYNVFTMGNFFVAFLSLIITILK